MSRFYRVFALVLMAVFVLSACTPAPAPAPAAPAAPAATQAPAAPAAPAAKAEPTKAPAAAPAAKAGAEYHGAFPYEVPPKGHLNSYVTAAIPTGIGPYQDLLHLPAARYYWADGKWLPLLAEKWGFQPPNKFTMNLRKGLTWSDGKPITSKDVVDTFNLGRLFKWTVFKYVDSVKALDDATVEFTMGTPSTVVERYVLTQSIRPSATYGALADEVQKLVDAKKGADSDEWKALVQKATDFRPDKLIVSGPYDLDMKSITEAQLSLIKNPKGYLADKAPFEKVVLYNGETPTVTPLVLAGDVDYATHGFPTATEKQYKDMGIRITRAPTYSGPALFLNQDVYPFNKPEFRQALAYAINRDENGKVSLGDSGKAIQTMAGFSDIIVPLWLSKEQQDKLNKYAYDPKKGEELLTKVGFKKGADGIWVDDKGKKLEFELSVPAEFADWSAAAENLAEQLNKFGVKTTVRGVNFQQHPTDVNQGKFQMAIRGWGAGNPHPHFAFVQDLFTHNYVGSTQGKGMNFPMKQTIDGKEVDLEKVVVQSAEGLDAEAQKANVATAATAFNQLLPIIPLWERYGNSPLLNKRVAEAPADTDPIWKNALYGDNPIVVMMMDGRLKAK